MGMIESKSGSRKVAVDVNIIPFIDLMSILIIFLLLTAVWMHSSLLNIDSSVYGKRNSEFQQPIQTKNKDVRLLLAIVEKGYRISYGSRKQFIPKQGKEYDSEGLLQTFKGFKEKHPDKEDVILFIHDKLRYKEMISGIDILLTSGFPKISVATDGGS